MNNKKKRLIPVLAYVGFLLVVLEGICRIALAIPWTADRLFSDEDLSWRRAWVGRQQSGTEIYYSFDQYDETKGWITRPNLRDEIVFGNKILNTNSHGLRGKTEFSFTRDPDLLRILVLGDSFTFGDEVNDDETYCHYLQRMLPAAEVINMGVHGYGHDQMLIHFTESGVKYQPDLVILGFNSFDMERNVLCFRDFSKPRFKIDGDELSLTNSPVAHPEDLLRFDWIRPRIYDIWSIVKLRLQVKTGRYERDKEALTRRILDEIVETTDRIGARPVFFYLPGDKELTNARQAPPAESFLLDYGRTNDRVECVSTRGHFLEKMDQGIEFKIVGHWGPPGHLTVAESIRDFLVDKGFIETVQSHPPLNTPTVP